MQIILTLSDEKRILEPIEKGRLKMKYKMTETKAIISSLISLIVVVLLITG